MIDDRVDQRRDGVLRRHDRAPDVVLRRRLGGHRTDARHHRRLQEVGGGLGPKDFLYGDLLLAKARVQESTKDSAGAIATYQQYLKDLPTSDRVQDVRIRLALLGGTG